MNTKITVLLMLILTSVLFSQKKLQGKIVDKNGNAITNANVLIPILKKGTYSNNQGEFSFKNLSSNKVNLRVSKVGYAIMTKTVELNSTENIVRLTLLSKTEQLDEVIVDGNLRKNKRVNYSTSKLPVKYQHQAQTVSVFTNKKIENTQATTLNEIVDYTPGVYQFATYGGYGNDFGARGIRGITVMRNGVRMQNREENFVDVTALESVEIIKGSSAILTGNVKAGGTINLTTKKPKFYNAGRAKLAYGSWSRGRAEVDVYGPLSENVAYRVAGAIQKGKSFRDYVEDDNFYINPSILYKFDENTNIVLEYLATEKNYTTDIGNVIYKKEISTNNNRFVGLKEDTNKATTNDLTITLNKKLSNNLKLRFTGSFVDNTSSMIRLGGFNDKRFKKSGNKLLFKRFYAKNNSETNRKYYQLDLLGEKIKTGNFTHTFQAGADYWTNKQIRFSTPKSKELELDEIDVNGKIPNTLKNLSKEKQRLYNSISKDNKTTTLNTNAGITLQDQISYNSFRLTLGGRLSYVTSKSDSYNRDTKNFIDRPKTDTYGFSPLVGLSYDFNEDFTSFITYTSSFNERNSGKLGVNGKELGNSYIDQVELGIKSSLLDNKLDLGLTLYQIFENNGIDQAVDNDGNIITGKGAGYVRTGKFRNRGIELDVNTKITKDLTANIAYSYIDAKYTNSSRYMDNATPFNTPKHSGSLWLRYAPVDNGLKGFYASIGTKYVGERKGNDYVKINWHSITAKEKPRTMDSYTQLDLMMGYKISKNFTIEGKLNNITDDQSYYSYREYFINPINPISGELGLIYSW